MGIWKWKSRSYHTVTEKWLGVETYVRNVRLKKYGTLSLPTGDGTYREVSLTEIRESPIKVDEYNQYGEFLKFYLRAADEEVEIIHEIWVCASNGTDWISVELSYSYYRFDCDLVQSTSVHERGCQR